MDGLRWDVMPPTSVCGIALQLLVLLFCKNERWNLLKISYCHDKFQ